jgi:hypothetical protein
LEERKNKTSALRQGTSQPIKEERKGYNFVYNIQKYEGKNLPIPSNQDATVPNLKKLTTDQI